VFEDFDYPHNLKSAHTPKASARGNWIFQFSNHSWHKYLLSTRTKRMHEYYTSSYWGLWMWTESA